MQNYCKTIGALAAASALVAGNASAQDSSGGFTQPYQQNAADVSNGSAGLEFEIHAGYSTEYIFRGLNFGDHLIETGIDASYELAGFGLSAGAWYATYDVGGVDAEELDLYAEVSKDLGFMTAAVGYIFYHFPNAAGGTGFDSQEVYFSLGKEFFGYETALTYYWETEDAGSGSGGYLEATVDKGYELSPCLALNTGAALGYLVEESEFAQVTAKVSLDWAFTETATLSPYVAASWGLTNDPSSNFYAGVGEELWTGVSLAVSF